MKVALMRSLLFAIVPLLLGVFADLILAAFYQGAQPEELRGQMLVLHAGVFLAVFVLAGVGAFLAYFRFRGKVPTAKIAALFGLLYSVASFFAVVFAFAFGGPIAVGSWLLAGAAIFAFASTLARAGHGG